MTLYQIHYIQIYQKYIIITNYKFNRNKSII